MVTPERAVLAAVLSDGSCFSRISDRLRPEDFFEEKNGTIWRAYQELSAKNVPIDLLTTEAHLKESGQYERAGKYDYLMELTEGLPDTANVEHYAELVYNASGKRSLLSLSVRLANRATGPDNLREVLDDLQGEILGMAVRGDPMGALPIGDVVASVAKQLEAATKGTRNDIRTGYYDLDRLITGFDPEDLVILAASTSVGKTALAVNIACNVCKQGKVVYFASLEMSREAIIKRILAREGHIHHRWFRQPELADGRFWQSLTAAQDTVADWHLFVDGTAGLGPSDLLARCRRTKSRHGLDLVVVDYLQLMTGKGDSLYHQVTSVSHALKGVAKELGVPVLALSQLSRDSVKEKRIPRLSDLRESGSIEQDADTVILLHAGQINGPRTVVDVIVAKQRNGPIGALRLLYEGDTLTFHNYGEDLDKS